MKRLVLPLSLLFATVACKKDASVGTEGASNAPEVVAPSTPDVVEAAPTVDPAADTPAVTSTLNIVSNGAEPRFPIRFNLADMEFGSFSTRTTSTTKIGEMEIATPTVVIPMTLSLVERKADAVRVRMTMGEMRVEANPSNPQHAMMAQAMMAQLNANSAADISYDMSAFGETSNFEFHNEAVNEIDANMRAALESSVGQVTSQLPRDPMGVGAEWRLEQSLAAGLPTPIRLEATYKVKEISAGRVVTDVTIPRTQMTVPVDESTVLDAFISAEGTVIFHEKSAVPEADIRMRMDMNTNEPTLGSATTHVRSVISAD